MPTVLDRTALNGESRWEGPGLFQESQKCPRADFATVSGYQETGTRNPVIFEQEYASRTGVGQGVAVHDFLNRDFAQVRGPRASTK